MSDGSRQWLELQFPSVVESEQVTALLRALHGLSRPGRGTAFIFQVSGNTVKIVHHLAVPTDRVRAVQAQATAALPGLLLTEVPPPTTFGAVTAWRLWLSTGRRPLRSEDADVVARTLLAAVGSSTEGTVVLQWWLGPLRRPLAVPTKHAGMASESWAAALATAPLLPPKEVDGESRSALRLKQGVPGWRAVGRLAAYGATRDQAHGLLGRLLAALRTAQGSGVALGRTPIRGRTMRETHRPWRWGLLLNVPELVGLIAWPLGPGVQAPVQRRPSRLLAVPRGVATRGRVLAVEPATERPIALKLSDSLQHLHLLGPTGVGKSTLLLNLITQDMIKGRGVVVIEPKGDLIQDVLGRVPEDRRGDVVVIDASDRVPVGINPLATTTPEMTADQLLSIFSQQYADSWGPRLSDVLHAALLTLARSSVGSLAAVPLLLTHQGFRRTVLKGLHDPFGVGPFWTWFERLSDGERQAVVAPVINKVRPLVVRPALRGVLGQTKPRFDLRQVFTSRTILLVDLSKGTLGPESARLLGTLVVHQLWQASLERARLAPERRHPVMVTVDEVQDYLGLPTSISEILSQSRGLGVGWTLAHQHLGQLPPETRSAVLANARSRVVFQVSADDAAVLARGQQAVSAEDFTHLPVREAYLRLVVDSEVTPYMSGRTLPPPEGHGDPDNLRQLSRESYGIDRAETDAALRTLTDGESGGPAIGRIGRSA